MAERNRRTETLPALAMRGLVVFEGMSIHFDAGRNRSILALKQAMQQDKRIFLVAQTDLAEDNPGEQGLYEYGVVATVKQLLRTQDDVVRVMVHGDYRAKRMKIVEHEPFLVMTVREAPLSKRRSGTIEELEALMRITKSLFESYCMLVPKLSHEVLLQALAADDPNELFDTIVFNIMLPYEDKQLLLECNNCRDRLGMLTQILEHETEVLTIEKELYEQVKEQMDKNQRDYYLREQLHVIQSQLGEGGEGGYEDLNEVMDAITAIQHISDDTREKLFKEADKLYKMAPGSQEANVIRTYIDTCLELPWDAETKDTIDLQKARRVLDRDHYGLDKVKDRILEVLAVRKLAPDIKGQIICLVGPPGVGKTSIGRSIAETMGRKYVRLSLGGVRDESDIRGHRKTYVGAMPGRIINALRQAKVRNPLILLDEIDKMGNDFRGDPSAAMLEVLDSEQNNAFRDHYIEVPFDLSEVLFITTANDLSTIPGPLLDRMEVIELSSYTREEKFQIAKKYLIPKQREKHGLKSKDVAFPDTSIYTLIDRYTREAGVRKLERTAASLCRKVAKRKVDEGEQFKKVRLIDSELEKLLGPKKYSISVLPEENPVGLVTGLAWTSVGGETLEIEAAVMDGTGKIQITGNLGDVMKESAQLAVSYVRTIAKQYGIDPDFYKNKDIHLHAPEGAVPKDGPSAGVTMTTALVSALSGIPVRRDVAMTGEISLRGRVMAIGGLKEKSIAAFRSGCKTVLIPYENRADIAQFDEVIREGLQFVPVKHIGEVLDIALVPQPAPKETMPAVLLEELPEKPAQRISQ